jgi:hypothetical protein
MNARLTRIEARLARITRAFIWWFVALNLECLIGFGLVAWLR